MSALCCARSVPEPGQNIHLPLSDKKATRTRAAVRILSECSVSKLIKAENLAFCRRVNCWKFFPVIGSPGKRQNNGIQEVVGSIPIGLPKIRNKTDVWQFVKVRKISLS